MALLACSDCYAESATPTYVLLLALVGATALALIAALALRRRRGVTRRAGVLVAAVVAVLLAVGTALPALRVDGWRSQPDGSHYGLVCGSALHASLQRWTSAPSDPGEARDDAYCAHWARVNMDLGEGLLGLAALVACGFLALVLRVSPRRATVGGLP